MPGVKLLIVDDEEKSRNTIHKYICTHTNKLNEIFLASNGQEAIDLILRYRPHIMLLDIHMPLKDGLTVMKEAIAAGICPKTIIMSGYDEFQYVQQALRYGAVDYLLKPCRASEILERIEALLHAEIITSKESAVSQPKDPQTGNPVVSAAVEYLREHYPDDITLSSVADYVGVSPSYLSTLFTRTLGIGFVDYLNSLRIERACDYFYDSRIKTYEVAFKVGFKDEKYFSNVFKRLKGESPSEYRKTLMQSQMGD